MHTTFQYLFGRAWIASDASVIMLSFMQASSLAALAIATTSIALACVQSPGAMPAARDPALIAHA
jgi:hypothetical protein